MMEGVVCAKKEKMGFEETELSLRLPGARKGGGDGDGDQVVRKRCFSETESSDDESAITVDLKLNLSAASKDQGHASIAKSGGGATDPTHDNKIPKEKTLTLLPADPAKPPSKAQVVGWPPVRSFRKNILSVQKNSGEESEKGSPNANGSFVKVSMDGAPYLRKLDLKMYKSYQDLSDALADMFNSFTIGNCGSQGILKDFMNESKLMDLLNSSDYVPTYEDKDGDWMLVGDVPWQMFVESCKRLRIMKGKEAIGLAPRAMEKCKNRS